MINKMSGFPLENKQAIDEEGGETPVKRKHHSPRQEENKMMVKRGFGEEDKFRQKEERGRRNWREKGFSEERMEGRKYEAGFHGREERLENQKLRQPQQADSEGKKLAQTEEKSVPDFPRGAGKGPVQLFHHEDGTVNTVPDKK